MEYNPKLLSFTYEKVDIDDPRLSDAWGKALYRLIFTDKKPAKKGSYRIAIRPS